MADKASAKAARRSTAILVKNFSILESFGWRLHLLAKKAWKNSPKLTPSFLAKIVNCGSRCVHLQGLALTLKAVFPILLGRFLTLAGVPVKIFRRFGHCSDRKAKPSALEDRGSGEEGPPHRSQVEALICLQCLEIRNKRRIGAW
jgi:hypothetical protein